MKVTVFISLLFTAFFANAAQTIVPLDMALGYWETTTEIEENDMIKQMLASVPEAQRDQMRAMMEGQVKQPIVKQCITEDTLKDMDKQMREAFGDQQQCKFNVTKSNNKEFIGELNCAGNITTIHTKVITSKRHESSAVSNIVGMGATNIRTIGEWKSATCPAGL
jgi:hypothetical protein